MLNDLIRLAKTPGWKAWAWHAAKEFEQLNPYDLRGMQDELKQRMVAEKDNNETSGNRDGDGRPLN